MGLLRKGTEAATQLQTGLSSWPAHKIEVNGVLVGTLHLAPTRKGRPSWADLFDDADDSPIKNQKQQTESAVLTLEVSGRTFVVPFGQGRHAVPHEALEPRFGRLVTLNSIDPSAVRMIDNIRFDGASRTSRTQLARPSSLIDFDLQPTAEIVKGLAGKASDQTFAKRIAGTTYAQITQSLDLESLAEAATECLSLFASTKYKKELGWLDQIEVITGRCPGRC